MLNQLGGNANTNFGASNAASVVHNVQIGGGSAQSHGLLRFDVGAVTGVVVDAFLSVTLRADAGGSFQVAMGILDDSDPQDGPAGWDESVVTFNDNLGLVVGLGAPSQTYLASQLLSGNNIDLSSASIRGALTDALNADTNGLLTLVFMSFMTKEGLTTALGGDLSFFADNPPPIDITQIMAPTLTVVTESSPSQAVDEPSTTALMGLSLLAISLIRIFRSRPLSASTS